ncbi:MAG: hypothetical protein HOP28_02865 [Gemmatimonadales bacterium]|nr:hypothetical protein [Gemmatimonadales bacterium]
MTEAPRRSVLVTDGNERAALASVRSLGKAGFEVGVLADRRSTLAGASRYAARSHLAPSPLVEPAAYADAVCALAKAHGYRVVLPMSEAAHLALYPVEFRLAPCRLAAAPADRFQAVCDKEQVLREATALGLSVPAQIVLSSRPGPEWSLPVDALFPLVVKPARSVVGTTSARRKLAVLHAADMNELKSLLAGLAEAAYPVLLQQRIPGEGIGVFLLIWEGRELANFAHRRIREKPPGGGVSVARESVAQDPDLLDRTRALFARFGWSGPGMLEFKRGADGTPYVMEINGRLWGSLQLAIDAGVDFPRLLVEAVLGAAPAPPPRYEAGVRTRWWWGDVDHLIARFRHPEDARLLPAGTPGPLRTALDVLLDGFRGAKGEILRLSDPGPFFRESLDWFRRGR